MAAGGAIIGGIGYGVAKLLGQSGAITSASTQAAQAQIQSWGSAGAGSFANTLVSLAQAGQGMLSAIQGAYLDTAGEFEKLFSAYLPQMYQRTEVNDEAAAGYAIAQANDWTDATNQQTDAALAADVNTLNQSIFDNRVSAHLEAESDYDSAIGQLQADKSQLQFQIAYQGQLSAAYTDTQVGYAEQAATQAIDGEAATRAQAISATQEIAATATAAVATVVNDWLKECGDPLCSNLSGFGNILNDLMGAITDGTVFAMLAEAIADPGGAIDAWDPEVRGVASTVGGILGQLLGIQI